MPAAPAPKQNLLLAALPEADFQHLVEHLELVDFPLGRSLYESGAHLQHVFFPIEGIVSFLYVTKGGNSAELAVVGREGMIGISLFMGGETTPNRAVVRSKTRAYRLPARILKAEFAKGGACSSSSSSTRSRSSRRSRRPQSATCTIPWTSSSAAGCC
jgi:CRP-like cAMP-binding protein